MFCCFVVLVCRVCRVALHQGSYPSVDAVAQALLAPGGWGHDLPNGALEISILNAGAHIVKHCGPTNHRIRLHLGISVPATGARINVGGEERGWVEGKVLVLDDSFEHEVWNDSGEPRVVLIADVWHPGLTEEDRARTRRALRGGGGAAAGVSGANGGH